MCITNKQEIAIFWAGRQLHWLMEVMHTGSQHASENNVLVLQLSRTVLRSALDPVVRLPLPRYVNAQWIRHTRTAARNSNPSANTPARWFQST